MGKTHGNLGIKATNSLKIEMKIESIWYLCIRCFFYWNEIIELSSVFKYLDLVKKKR